MNGTPTLFIADGKDKEIWTVKPGTNGIFEGRGDDVMTHFDTLSLGQDNPEDVAFDSRDSTLWIVSNKTAATILHTTLTGTADRDHQRHQQPVRGTRRDHSRPGQRRWR